MTDDHRGMLYSVLTALVWAVALMFFKKSGDRQVSPLSLNLFKNTLALVLFAGTLLLMGDSAGSVHGHGQRDVYLLVVSGIIGLAICDTLLFYSLNLLNVSVLVIVDCLYGPCVMLFSCYCLSEELTFSGCIGAALILAAVLITLRYERPADRTRGQIAAGIALGVVSIITLVVGIMIMVPVLKRGFPVVWATSIRLLFGTAFLALMGLMSSRPRDVFSVFRPSSNWKLTIPGSVLGAYLCLLLWVAGYRYTQASVSAVLNQTHTIFATVLASIWLKEAFSWRKGVAVGLAMAGVAVVALDRPSASDAAAWTAPRNKAPGPALPHAAARRLPAVSPVLADRRMESENR